MAADAGEAPRRVGLEALAERAVAGLAYGQLKRIELARAIMKFNGENWELQGDVIEAG
jgi:ABC-type branched-subunit amino acid transport system ATPase component